jgi:hypothetical protein
MAAGTLTAVVDHLTPFAAMVDPDFPPLPDAAGQWADAAGHWAEAAILRLASVGAVSGFEDGTFRPDLAVTRAQFARFLAVALGLEPGTAIPAVFADAAAVPGWAQARVAAMAEHGIMGGMPGGVFDPSATLTRAQAVTVLSRAMNVR